VCGFFLCVWRELGREVAFFMVFVCFLLLFLLAHTTHYKFMYELCLLVDVWWLFIDRGL
jgi:hypothetical protein